MSSKTKITNQKQQEPLRIGFLHPDLGIGGAEQLVVNLALGLQQKGHSIIIYTPFHDKNHCFKETANGTLEVEVRGNIFPRHIFGKCIALCAYLRMFFAALFMIFFGGYFDVIIVDQVSIVVPLFRFFNRKVLFYCHFPDQLLCVERKSFVKKLYRLVIDTVEELSLYFANLIVVNSLYTKDIFAKNFKLLNRWGIHPDVLYPAVDFTTFKQPVKNSSELTEQSKSQVKGSLVPNQYFFSLNRYERKQNIGLAIESFAEFIKAGQTTKGFQLVIAGGYDERLNENQQHKQQLEELAQQLGVDSSVVFKINITNEQRSDLLSQSAAVLYTPENEHFGIVPCETMYMKKPIIACNSGGPKQSVEDGVTGFLIETNPQKWAEKMLYIANNPEKAQQMGIKGNQRVIKLFGMDSFSNATLEFVNQVIKKKLKKN